MFHSYHGPINVQGFTFNDPIIFDDDFIGVGTTVQDIDLTAETRPYGHFATAATGNSTTAGTGVWIVTFDTDGTLPAVSTAGDGGWITLVTSTTTARQISMQVSGEAFKFARGRKMMFSSRYKVSGTGGDAFLGMAVTTTDPHASRPAGFFAVTNTAAATLQYATGNASTATASASSSGSLVADTFAQVTMIYNGDNKIYYYKDGAQIAIATATLPYDIVLSPVVCFESNGAAVTATIDRVTAMVERG